MDLVFLHGPAASGKLTTGRVLSQLTGIPLFHNHLVVNAVVSCFEFGSPQFIRLRNLFWLSTFDEAARAGRSLIFTFAPESSVPVEFPDRMREVVCRYGGRVCSVALQVSEAEQERRIGNPDRVQVQKLSDVDILRRNRRGPSVEPPPADLAIDTERSSPESSARRIIETFGLRSQPAHVPWPEPPA